MELCFEADETYVQINRSKIKDAGYVKQRGSGKSFSGTLIIHEILAFFKINKLLL